jgi:uncharacterized protein (DUF2336 family)
MDVKALIQEPSTKVRGQLAAKLAMDYRSGNFTETESAIANDILRVLVKDVEKNIRQALSEQLATCTHTPRDVVIKLANDATEVAVPMLEYSIVLTEDDLIAIVESCREVVKLRAIARREVVSADLASALIATHEELVLDDLFKNKGAVINEPQLMPAWNYINTKPTLLETLVRRGGLPLAVTEKLFAVVSDELKQQIISRYKFNSPFMHKAVSDTREWKMLGIIPPRNDSDPNDDGQVEDLIDQMHMNGRLTHSVLIRALCTGNVGIFEAGMAKLADAPRPNVRIILLDGGKLGFDAIYKRSGMPEGFMDAVRMLLKISLEESEFGHCRAADFRKRVIDRIYSEGYNESVENMEYILAIIGGKIVASN